MSDYFLSLHMLLIDPWLIANGAVWRHFRNATPKLAKIADEENQ